MATTSFSTRAPVGSYLIVALDRRLQEDPRNPDVVSRLSTGAKPLEISAATTATIGLDVATEKESAPLNSATRVRYAVSVWPAASLRQAGLLCRRRSSRSLDVVVSSRDGSPVPRCRITASAVPVEPNWNEPELRKLRVAVPDLSLTSDVVVRVAVGRVADRAADLVEDRRASFRAANAASAAPETTADESGRFTLDIPRAGAWMLTAAARGFRSQNYDEHDGFYSAVVLTETAPEFNLTYKLTPDSILTGLIVDEAGEPVASAQVTAELIPEPLPGDSANSEAARDPGQSGYRRRPTI